MLRCICSIVLIAATLAACGQKGPLVLPEEARRRQAPPSVPDEPPTREPAR